MTHCDKVVSYGAGEYAPVPVRCRQSVGVRRWTDSAGYEHRACPKHVAELIRRNPPAEIDRERVRS